MWITKWKRVIEEMEILGKWEIHEKEGYVKIIPNLLKRIHMTIFQDGQLSCG